MNKKRLLRYRTLKREETQLRQRLAEMETIMYYPKIQSGNGIPSTSFHDNVQEQLVIRHAEAEEQLKAKLTELFTEQMAIEDAISALDPMARMVIRARYLDGLAWENVCCVVGYSWRQTHRIHGRALQKLAEMEDYD